MICPACQAENEPLVENCFKCGKGLFVLTAGQILASRYEVLSPLGKGGMGMVYKAHDRHLDEMVAIKVLRPDFAQSAQMARRFRSEIKLARKVRHRNVCGIHEYGQDGRFRFIAMELIEGTDFKRTLRRRGSLPAKEALDVAIEVAAGLQAIHEVGIVHRDLKTPNIMRDATGRIRLMDFGVAKSFESGGSSGATATGQVVGTPEYMSPEQARAETLDARSDIYALGIVVFELLTGDVPFRGDTPLATLFQQIQQPVPLDVGRGGRLPEPVKRILRRALAKARPERYASAREMAEALRQARDELFPEAAHATGAAGASTEVPPPQASPESQTLQVLATPRTTPTQTVTGGPPTLLPPTPAPEAQPPHGGRGRGRSLPWAVALPVLLAVIGLVTGVILVRPWRVTGPDDRHALAPPDRSTAAPPADRSPSPTPDPPATPGTLTSAPPPSLAPAPSPPPRAAATARNDATTTPPASSAMTLSAAPPTPETPTAGIESAPPPEPAETASVEATPTPVPTGRLELLVLPWASVSVDGRNIGTTPFRPVSLPAGTHVVVLSHPSWVQLERKITIQPGQLTTLEIDLSDEAFPK